MGHNRIYIFTVAVAVAVLSLFCTLGTSQSLGNFSLTDILRRTKRHSKSASVPTAPLDINENIHHTLDELNSILGTLGGATSGAVMGLTGISITDCGLSFQGDEVYSMSCPEFIDKLSECDSLSHLKPLLQQAKQRYRRKPNSKAPCFAQRSSSSHRRHG